MGILTISNALYDNAIHKRSFYFFVQKLRNENLVVIVVLKSFTFSLLMLLFSMIRNHSDA